MTLHVIRIYRPNHNKSIFAKNYVYQHKNNILFTSTLTGDFFKALEKYFLSKNRITVITNYSYEVMVTTKELDVFKKIIGAITVKTLRILKRYVKNKLSHTDFWKLFSEQIRSEYVLMELTK